MRTAGMCFVPALPEFADFDMVMSFADNEGEGRRKVFRSDIEAAAVNPVRNEELRDFLKLYNTFIFLGDNPEEGKAPWFAYYDEHQDKICVGNFGEKNAKTKWMAYIDTRKLPAPQPAQIIDTLR